MSSPNTQEILAGVRRLAASAGADVSQETINTLTAAKGYLPLLAKQKEQEVSELQQEAAALPPRIEAAATMANQARNLLHGVEDAHNRLVKDHLQANAKTISGKRHDLEMALAERSRCQTSFFPTSTWQEAQAERESELATRWKELETEIIPRLEKELAALENVKF